VDKSDSAAVWTERDFVYVQRIRQRLANRTTGGDVPEAHGALVVDRGERLPIRAECNTPYVVETRISKRSSKPPPFNEVQETDITVIVVNDGEQPSISAEGEFTNVRGRSSDLFADESVVSEVPNRTVPLKTSTRTKSSPEALNSPETSDDPRLVRPTGRRPVTSHTRQTLEKGSSSSGVSTASLRPSALKKAGECFRWHSSGGCPSGFRQRYSRSEPSDHDQEPQASYRTGRWQEASARFAAVGAANGLTGDIATPFSCSAPRRTATSPAPTFPSRAASIDTATERRARLGHDRRWQRELSRLASAEARVSRLGRRARCESDHRQLAIRLVLVSGVARLGGDDALPAFLSFPAA
jgi:hypothetical protein